MNKILNIESMYVSLWCIFTLGMIFTNSAAFAYLSAALLISLIFFVKKEYLVFLLFLLSTIAWGASINLQYRFGSIMLSDISLFVLTVTLFVNRKGEKNLLALKKSTVINLFIAIWFFVFGVLSGYRIGNVLQDFKLFLYVFIPFCFLRNINPSDKFFRTIRNFMVIYAVVVFFLEVRQLATISLRTMIANGFGNRDVAIIVQFIPVVACVLFVNRKNESALFQIVLQGVCFIACLFSFTRTIWITYVICFAITMLMSEHQAAKNLGNTVLVLASVLVIFTVIRNMYPNIYNKFFGAVLSRITDSTNNNNTMEHRWIQSRILLETKVMRPLSLIGAGHGEITELKNSVFMENSILYYIWKYGIFLTIYYVFCLIKNVISAYRTNNSTVRTAALTLAFVCIVGNFSGNLNLYYCMPALSFLFASPYVWSKYREKVNSK